ncbi:hypothetical protein [Secundilactobacillus similis]|uniref:DUF1642 domain-containing protein n=1 Tax=Secundilactobacillus similis DSM 23365 = JCM 2765 TaxID=1423804 RepID=A0A0R2EVH2_9LACO|nr:hypothetical protein [Secundilactobacillus similis]KRN17797.1 hypothetical protein FD14_GL002521 [Secundilactobacillus similis DSM 23365 = JCM 2765]
MKDKELLSALKEQGYAFTTADDMYTVRKTPANDPIMWISRTEPYSLDTRHVELEKLNADAIDELLDVVMDYIVTPLAERRDEPRFMVKVWRDYSNWLNVSRYTGGLILSNDTETDEYQTSFTKSEYEALRKNNTEYAPYLPPFNRADPRFEMVKDGD